jgi:hypothetical protein
MRTSKYSIVILLCALLYVPTALAQQVRNEGIVVTGTSASTDEKSAPLARNGKRESENEKNGPLAGAASGTTGLIAKFISATDLGDSVMTELNGNIGIGTANPQGKLDVSGNIVLNGNAKTQLSASGDLTFLNGGGVVAKGRFVELDMSPNGSGRLAIGGNPNDNNVFLFGFSADRTSSAAAMWFAGKDGGKLPLIQMSAVRTFIDGNVGIGTIFPQSKLDVAGQTRTKTLQIVGGSDFSENFDIDARPSSALEAMNVEPGLVVSIDTAHPGKLTLSTQAYDRHVAGIISGAGGVNPGVIMSQAGTLADGQHPVALTGRVYCWADASYAPITPGDLLTTSDTPGHAMNVTDHAKAQGAIIGKAMTGLRQGKGLVLVLVTLQ